MSIPEITFASVDMYWSSAHDIAGQLSLHLDYHLHGLKLEPVAAVLSERGIPYAIASGMDREDMRSSLVNVPMLPKPYIMDDMSKVLGRLLKVGKPPVHGATEQHQKSA